MSGESNSGTGPKKISVGQKVGLGFLILCYLLFCAVLILFITKFNQEQDEIILIALESPAIQSAVGLMLLGCLFSVAVCARQMVAPLPKGNRYQKFGKGITLLSFIGSLLLIIGVSQSGHAHRRTPDRDTRNNLHSLYMACQTYWADNGSDKDCNADQYYRNEYGFIQSNDVSVSGSGTATTFTAKGTHSKGPHTFVIDSTGTLTELDQ